MLEVAIFALTYILIALDHPKLDRASVALIGATAMIISGVITLDEAVRSVDYDTIILLFGMMVLSSYLGKSGLFDLIASKIILKAKNGRTLLLIVVVTAGGLSALLVNDVVCVFMTPIVVRIARVSNVDPIPLLLALATSANIGSCATVVGNPQNMLIAMKFDIPFTDFARIMAPISAISLGICYIILYGLFGAKLKTFKPKKLDYSVDVRLCARMLFVLLVVMVLFVTEIVPIPVSALIGTTLAFVLGDQKPREIVNGINWSLLLFFAGLFVVVAGFEKGYWIEYLKSLNIQTLVDYFVFGWITVIFSNVISNVPFVMIAVKIIEVKKLAYLLAMVSTFAGNLTLMGSVANIIVAEFAVNLGVKLSFKDYLKVGVPLTIVTVTFGILIIYYFV